MERDCCTVACASPTLACAEVSAALLRVSVSISRSVSICASNWPLTTLSFTSTVTVVTSPESSEPTATWLVGARLPVAVTFTTKSPRVTASVE